MNTHGGFTNFYCIVLAVALAGSWLLPEQTEVIILIEPVDTSVFEKEIVLEGFTKDREAMIREALLPKLSGQCKAAFRAAGLPTPWQIAWDSGFVIQYSRDLYVKEAEDLGLLFPATRDAYRAQFSTGRAQGGTVPYIRNGTVLTLDGMPHIFLHDLAFVGESAWFGTISLTDVLTHELLHAAGQPPTPGWLGFLSHDLAGLENYDEIIEACR